MLTDATKLKDVCSLKENRDIALPTKVPIVKNMAFLLVFIHVGIVP